MPRPQPAPSAALKRNRPEDHAFAQPSTTASPTAPPASAVPPSPDSAASRIAAEPPDPLVKFSIRVPPAEHRHIKVTAARAGMSIQDLAVTAIREYLDRLGHPLPTERAT